MDHLCSIGLRWCGHLCYVCSKNVPERGCARTARIEARGSRAEDVLKEQRVGYGEFVTTTTRETKRTKSGNGPWTPGTQSHRVDIVFMPRVCLSALLSYVDNTSLHTPIHPSSSVHPAHGLAFAVHIVRFLFATVGPYMCVHDLMCIQ